MAEILPTNEKIAVYGGAFNPPTVAHQQIIETCLQLDGFSEVWVMPSGDRADKSMQTDDNERLAMLNLLKETEFDNDNRLVISDYELNLPRPSNTVRTVGSLAVDFPDKDFWFVYGADSYQTMPFWPNGRELQSRLSVLLLPRLGIELPPESEHTRHLPDIEANANPVSSTQVREAIRAKKDIGGMVSEAVRSFILAQSVYAAAG